MEQHESASASSSMNTGSITGAFIREALVELREKMIPVAWYASSRYIEKGTMFLVPETDMNPEFYLINDDDINEFTENVTSVGRIPKDLRDFFSPKRFSWFKLIPPK